MTGNHIEMTIAQQIHTSATHKTGLDPACPICNPVLPKLAAICKSLARNPVGDDNRMLRIIRRAMTEIMEGDTNNATAKF